MLDDLVPRHSVETTHYECVFRLEDGSGGAFAFECDARGGVFLGGLPQIARHCLERCLQGEVDGFRVRPGIVRPSTRSFITPRSGRCLCGQRVVLTSARSNACETCGRAYDGSGVELDDRSLWGEGAGQSVSAAELDDPERYG